MAEPIKRRRWFRFSLRMLLVVVTLAAVASWGYWVGWPWWQAYHRQVAFESALREIKIGSTLNDAEKRLPSPNGLISTLILPARFIRPRDNIDGRVAMSRYLLGDSVYCIYYTFSDAGLAGDHDQPCTTMAVFRLPRVPQHASPDKRVGVASENDSQPHEAPPPEGILSDGYVSYFLWFVAGDRKDNPGFQYELIYSDPPAKAGAK